MTSPKQILCMLLSLSLTGLAATDVHAGPLLDWLFGRQQPAYAVGAPVPVGTAPAAAYASGYAPHTSGYAPYWSGYAPTPASPPPYTAGYSGYPPVGSASAQPMLPAPAYSQPGYSNGANIAVVPPNPTSLSYVPNYRSTYNRAPVTYYRPVLSTDPVTGAQTTTMTPCTSYEHQAQRVPALGRSALFGSYETPTIVATPSTTPTYTLPSGGVPLNYYTPGLTTRGYGGYTTAPTAQAVVGAGAYQTQPMNSTFYGADPYYGTQTGGCTGNTVAPYSSAPYEAAPYNAAPGLVAPPAPTYAPGPATGGYPSGAAPSSTYPPAGAYPSGTYPPSTTNPGAGMPSTDPADTPPSLSGTPTRFRPQVRSRTVYPDSNATSANGSTTQTKSADSWKPSQPSNSAPAPSPFGDSQSYPSTEPSSQGTLSRSTPASGNDMGGEFEGFSQRRSVASEPERLPTTTPSIKPMPVPRDFQVKPWNPSLLREDDLTASADRQNNHTGMRATSESRVDWSKVAGTSKQIRWASFPAVENAAKLNEAPQARAPQARAPLVSEPIRQEAYIAQPSQLRSQQDAVQTASAPANENRSTLELSGSMPSSARHPAHSTLSPPSEGAETYRERRSPRRKLFDSAGWQPVSK